MRLLAVTIDTTTTSATYIPVWVQRWRLLGVENRLASFVLRPRTTIARNDMFSNDLLTFVCMCIHAEFVWKDLSC